MCAQQLAHLAWRHGACGALTASSGWLATPPQLPLLVLVLSAWLAAIMSYC